MRGGTSVYIVKSTKSNQSYYLKHICIPESQKQVDALMFTGAAATVEDAQNYYKQVAADYQAELETLEKLSASPNIGCYRSYQIEPKEDGVGFEIYLLAEYRQTLAEVLAGTPMTQSGAVNLGVDLCSALCSLREAGLIHRNVKPSNVYLSSSGHYLLGDLGIAKIDELKYCSMPETMLSSFSAPELFSLLGTIEPTTDIYSVGMILYRIYNGNHGPFEDEKTSARAGPAPEKGKGCAPVAAAGTHQRGGAGRDLRGGVVLHHRAVRHVRQLRDRDRHRLGLSDRAGRVRRGKRRVRRHLLRRLRQPVESGLCRRRRADLRFARARHAVHHRGRRARGQEDERLLLRHRLDARGDEDPELHGHAHLHHAG